MIKERKDNSLDFVMHFYEEGRLDTRKALRKVKQHAKRPVAHIIIWRQRIAIAASLLLLLCGGGYLYWNSHRQVLLAANEKAQLFILPDNTHVTLSSHSTLLYNKGDDRTVTLDGNAYFEVHRDEQHPFTISNDMARIQVLGTKFQVRGSNGSQKVTEVFVTEGKVAFSAIETGQQGLILTHGMKARLLPGEDHPQLITAGSINQVAWATGLFHFNNTPLTEVLADLAQFYHVKLRASDTHKRLSGDFETDSLEEILTLIEQVLEVRIIRDER